MNKYIYSLRSSPNLVFAGIRDVAKKSGEFKEYIDLTSPVPWWRQMRNKELLYESSREVYRGEKFSADPSDDKLPIFDDGYFCEDQAKKSIEYLKQYEARNPDILNIKKSTHPSSKPSLREDLLALEKYERKKKKFQRVFKRKKLSLIQSLKDTHRLDEYLDTSSIDNEAQEAFQNYYVVHPILKTRTSFRETIEKEFAFIKDDHRILRFISNEWIKGASIETSPEKANYSWAEENIFEAEAKESGTFEQRSVNEKLNQNTRELYRWRAWKELRSAYNDYDGDLRRDLRSIERLGHEDKNFEGCQGLHTDQELLNAVICVNTSTHGCNPDDILSWLLIKPPIPNFRCADLSHEIGYRWVLDTEEWLKKHEILLNRQEFENLARSAVTFVDVEVVGLRLSLTLKNSCIVEEDELPEFVPQEQGDLIPPLPGFAAEEVIVSVFSDSNSGTWQVHHPNHYKLIICDEYPSYCYGNLEDTHLNISK